MSEIPENQTNIAISFCTTCYNRVDQLASTFPTNAAVIAAAVDCEWIIVDFGSTDGVREMSKEWLRSASTRVRFFFEESNRPWHLSRAKNVAHRLARGAVLMSLDCDNFIAGADEILRKYFRLGAKVVHLWSGVPRDGTSGRIAVDSKLFYKLGGYDESFLPMGYQDIDFLRRLSASGVPILHRPSPEGAAIANTKKASVANCGIGGCVWEDYDRRNRETSAMNIAEGKLVANSDQPWAPIVGCEQAGRLGS